MGKSSKRKTRLTTILIKRKTKNKENYKNKNYKKFTTILISFSTWISKKIFFFNSPKIFAIINVRANENIPFLIFVTKVFQNLQKMMISEKLGFFDTLASAKFVMQKKKKKPLHWKKKKKKKKKKS